MPPRCFLHQRLLRPGSRAEFCGADLPVVARRSGSRDAQSAHEDAGEHADKKACGVREKAEHLVLSLSVCYRKMVAAQTKISAFDQAQLIAWFPDILRYSGAPRRHSLPHKPRRTVFELIPPSSFSCSRRLGSATGRPTSLQRCALARGFVFLFLFLFRTNAECDSSGLNRILRLARAAYRLISSAKWCTASRNERHTGSSAVSL